MTIIKVEALHLGADLYSAHRPAGSKIFIEAKGGHPNTTEWVSKLLGYDFTVEYKRGKENKAADALSRVQINNDITDAYAIPTDQHTGHDMTCRHVLQMQRQFQQINMQDMTCRQRQVIQILKQAYMTHKCRYKH
jgi:hypothetical protein